MHNKTVFSVNYLIEGVDHYVKSDSKLHMKLSATHHGDRDEFWIVGIGGGEELFRFNCKNLSRITWG